MKLREVEKVTVFFLLTFGIVAGAYAKEQPPANRVSMTEARKTALDAVQGKVKDEELEFEGGKWIYSFDLTSKKDSKIHEVQVDAITGKVVNMHVETARDEQKEKQQDAEAAAKTSK